MILKLEHKKAFKLEMSPFFKRNFNSILDKMIKVLEVKTQLLGFNHDYLLCSSSKPNITYSFPVSKAA